MSENVQHSSSPEENDDAKLDVLVNSVIERHNAELSEIISHWNELKRDENRRLNASSFILRPVNWDTQFVISVKSSSAIDLAVWKVCLEITLVKLNISATFETSSKSVSITVANAEVGRVLDYIAPLFQRTNFANRTIDSLFAAQLAISHVDTAEQMDQILHSAMDGQRKRSKQFKSYWETLKINNNHQMPAQITIQHHYETIRIGDIDVLQFDIQFSYHNDLSFCGEFLLNAIKNVPPTLMKTMQNMESVEVFMKKEDLEGFLGCLKPLSRRMRIRSLVFKNIQSDILKSCSEFFESVEEISISPHSSGEWNFKPWIYFIKKVRPHIMRYELPVNSDEIQDFILPLANFVECIEFWESRHRQKHLNPISVIREILSRKCNTLRIRGTPSIFSLSDAEELVKFFHKLDKKCSLQMPAEVSPMNVQIGEYKVEASQNFPGRCIMIIKHMEK